MNSEKMKIDAQELIGSLQGKIAQLTLENSVLELQNKHLNEELAKGADRDDNDA
jgi:regulator of replication initiation timing